MDPCNKKALLKLQKPKAVIFDWDNTLVGTWPLMHLALNHTMKTMGFEELDQEQTKARVHNSMKEYFPKIFGDSWQQAGQIYLDKYRSFKLDDLQFLPSAPDLINKLRQNNILLSVVSNKSGDLLRREVKHLKVDDKFFSVVGSMDAIADKPSKETVELALLGSDLNPIKDHIWFIGDTIVDLECAYNSNCHPIIYGNNSSIDQQILLNGKNKEGPIAVINDHQELINIIDNLFIN